MRRHRRHAGTKRAAEGEPTGPTTRSAKTPKTDSAAGPTTARGRAKGGKRGPKTNLAVSQFKARAMPLHVNITHTPPVLPDAEENKGESETTTVPVASIDPGFIASTTLVPSTFTTGTYGWKGSKRLTIELPNTPNEEGEKEKVHVVLSINAVVMGSKSTQKEPAGAATAENGDGEEQAGAQDDSEEKNDADAKEASGTGEPMDADITEATKEPEPEAPAEGAAAESAA
ncbi:hypothetical protein WOLCODRAFT_64606 [Wolfiporia cocos MD-104 SS10]|uniref:Uncharacterized protein n=1 Tax=Wolfiporia cocos (strain MD-104) TaxID=742152 RepID=A0A2H3J838_WOLCO|nr:hypothetical protein WOLCODRAFT_64606 [Wolfiporia cocos MD-104 SS10]